MQDQVLNNSNKLRISALYVAVFGRAPDKAGLDFWMARANSTTDVFQTIANGFVQHPVFTQVYGNLTGSAFVNALYTNILGGPGDAAGVAFWTGQLATRTQAQVLSSFVQSSLETNLLILNLTTAELAAAQVRQATITSKSTVGVAFADLLGTASNLSTGTNTNTLAGLQADPAYKFSVSVLDGVKTKGAADFVISELTKAAASVNPLAFIANLIAVDEAKLASRTIVITSVQNPTGAGKIYALDGINKPELPFVRGAVYVFDQSDASNVTHQMAFKDANGNAYTTGVVTTGIAGQAGAKTVITIASDAPSELRYYCIAHGNNMGNVIKNTGGAASYFLTSGIDTAMSFDALYENSFDDTIEFFGVTLAGIVDFDGA